jgi:hypothetical protein
MSGGDWNVALRPNRAAPDIIYAEASNHGLVSL